MSALPKVDMDETVAAAVLRLSTGKNEGDWQILQHYIALQVIRARDYQEDHASERLGGFTKGLRFLFELAPRALAKTSGENFERQTGLGKGLPPDGEAAYVVDPLEDDAD